MSHKSKLLNEMQVSNLTEVLPVFNKQLNWKLLYRLSDHGISMNTMMSRLSNEQETLMIFEDEVGFKFGSFCTEAWHFQKDFYGNGENFVFTFKDGQQCEEYKSKYKNDFYQFSDSSCIGMGSGSGESRFAIYLGSDLYRGSSSKTECFDNEQLTSN